ncbi:MAG: rhodanese-like domain-containing protein [Pseudomonadota bacterium]
MRYFRELAGLCGVFMLLCLPVVLPAADDYTSPDTIEGTIVIDAGQLIELVGNNDDMVMIDSRIKEDRTEGYIEGSHHLVDRDTDCDSLARLLSDKTTPVVFYCNSINCDRSDRAVVIARDCGYTEIYWFRGGVEEWREKSFPLIQ